MTHQTFTILGRRIFTLTAMARAATPGYESSVGWKSEASSADRRLPEPQAPEATPAPNGGLRPSAFSALREQPGLRIVFSGDLGAPNSPLLPAPESPERADILVLESTYGDRQHEDRSTRQARLKAAIDHALDNGGTVIIPAFSIGRTQELLYELEDLIHTHTADGDATELRPPAPASAAWQDLEIIVDSPLAARFTTAYRDLKPYWDAEAHQRLSEGRHPLAFENLYTVDTHEEHQQTVDYLARTGRPAVVIAASGMAAGGRVVNYLKRMLNDERHDVLFVGYQAAGTPGRAIQRHGPRGGWVELDGERIDIRAKVHTIGGYSAHADQNDLLAFIQGIPQAPKEIRLIHGAPDAREALKTEIETWAESNGHNVEVTFAAQRRVGVRPRRALTPVRLKP